jgi:hypothetical protein
VNVRNVLILKYSVYSDQSSLMCLYRCLREQQKTTNSSISRTNPLAVRSMTPIFCDLGTFHVLYWPANSLKASNSCIGSLFKLTICRYTLRLICGKRFDEISESIIPDRRSKINRTRATSLLFFSVSNSRPLQRFSYGGRACFINFSCIFRFCWHEWHERVARHQK